METLTVATVATIVMASWCHATHVYVYITNGNINCCNSCKCYNNVFQNCLNASKINNNGN